jgi:hypothetical protein
MVFMVSYKLGASVVVRYRASGRCSVWGSSALGHAEAMLTLGMHDDQPWTWSTNGNHTYEEQQRVMGRSSSRAWRAAGLTEIRRGRAQRTTIVG